jgi:hypothetical protein
MPQTRAAKQAVKQSAVKFDCQVVKERVPKGD